MHFFFLLDGRVRPVVPFSFCPLHPVQNETKTLISVRQLHLVRTDLLNRLLRGVS